jgi:thymidylate synthase (FAD)
MLEATLIDHMGSDLTTVNAARVSFGKKSELVAQPFPDGNYYNVNGWTEEGLEEVGWSEYDLSERDKKLIKFLAKHKHMSPFGHAFASFHVKAPIFVARQLVKHKFLRWNEISRRYVDEEPEFYVPDVWRGRSEDKKQGSDGEVNVPIVARTLYGYQEETYKSLLQCGVAPEQARMVLPQSTMTEWYWSGSLDAFAAMCKLRCASDSQYESRVVADQISEVMSGLYPVSWSALTAA